MREEEVKRKREVVGDVEGHGDSGGRLLDRFRER
jgi:hypothetical protein